MDWSCVGCQHAAWLRSAFDGASAWTSTGSVAKLLHGLKQMRGSIRAGAWPDSWRRPRYTSYGRHFTHRDRLVSVNQVLLPHLQPDDMVVDTSCGANDWVPLLREACKRQRGFSVRIGWCLMCEGAAPTSYGAV